MKQEEEIKIVMTGGHAATTGLAVIDEIHSLKLPWKLYWVGAKFAVEGKKIPTLEYAVIPDFGVTFLPLTMGRIQRKFTLYTIPSLLKIPLGFIHAFYYLLKIRPALVLSFGGFTSFPVSFAAKVLGIPLIIHEQTAAAGRANIASARFADKIVMSRAESTKYFPAGKTVLLGNPVAKKSFNVNPIGKLPKTPTIFITGGSRGSQNINLTISEILIKLLKNYKVIHQTGLIDIERFEEIKNKLPDDLSKNYEVFSGVDPAKIIDYYEKADLIIGRAGANTVSEILAVGRPAILIPLSISYMDEQTKNAMILENLGTGKIIPQKSLTGEKLLTIIGEIFSKYPEYVNKINKFKSPDKDASEKLVNLLKEYI